MPAVRSIAIADHICTCPADSPLPDRTPPIATPDKRRVRSRRAKNQDHIPRPRNAFIIFRSHYIHFLKSKHNVDDHPSSEHQQNQLSKIAAKVWNGMDPDARKPYAEEAKREKEWHKEMYPDYVYRAPPAGETKTKNFKIKVKMGNPSKRRAPSDAVSSSSSNSDIQVVAVAPRPGLENSTSESDQYLWPEHEKFVPTECIPPLELSPSLHNEADTAIQLKEPCPPQEPTTYAVDLSPRSLAYDQCQARDSDAVYYPDDAALVDHIWRYECGMTEPNFGGGFGSEQVLLPTAAEAFVDVPGSFKLDGAEGILQPAIDTRASLFAPHLTASSSSSSFVGGSFLPQHPTSFDLDFFSLTSSAAEAEAFQVVPEHDNNSKFMLDLDFPGFNFELGDGQGGGMNNQSAVMMMMEEDEMSRGLAVWAGYE